MLEVDVNRFCFASNELWVLHQKGGIWSQVEKSNQSPLDLPPSKNTLLLARERERERDQRNQQVPIIPIRLALNKRVKCYLLIRIIYNMAPVPCRYYQHRGEDTRDRNQLFASKVWEKTEKPINLALLNELTFTYVLDSNLRMIDKAQSA